MKKTLKLVLIFVGVLVSVIVVSLTGYFVIANNKTFHIYDLKLVERNETMSGYIYTDSEVGYTPIKNKTVYMNSGESDLYPIAVYLSTTTSTDGLKITSSDPSIAKIVYKSGKCYVQYLKEGFVTITSEFYGVTDKFDIQIYDQVPSEFNVYDYEYYGDYAELSSNTNRIVSYADEVEYRYGFFINNSSQNGDNSSVDSNLIEVDESCLNFDNFEYAKIDPETNELVIKCKTQDTTLTDNIDDLIILQSFFYDEDGKKVGGNTYKVYVHIELYIPQFLQVEVSSTPNFKESVVYTHYEKEQDFKQTHTPDEINEHPDLLNDYLRAEKEENFLEKNDENLTHNVFFTKRVKEVYLRFRMVYSNGDIVYLNDENSTISMTNETYCVLGPSGDYYIMTLESGTFDITVDLKGYETKHTFTFKYSNNYNDFYSLDKETGIYTFNYWDKRAKFSNAIPDENGNIVGFGD